MAARSWLGAYVEDMLAAWPNPNMRCGSNTIGESGCVWWRHRQDNTPGGDIQFDYRCEAIVRYNEAGVITEVDVRQSSNCHRRYGDQLQRMRRDTSPEVSATIEDLK